jgi:hypothetical protein
MNLYIALSNLWISFLVPKRTCLTLAIVVVLRILLAIGSKADIAFGEFTVLVLNGIPFEMTFNTLPNRLFAAHEFLSSDLFVHLDVTT